MRLWSLHPRYLDSTGLVALWGEGLLAQAVLRSCTTGYRVHPQLRRLREQASPVAFIGEYLRRVYIETVAKNYGFDDAKVADGPVAGLMDVTRGQLAFEWRHLARKLEARGPGWLEEVLLRNEVGRVPPHPLFPVVEGHVASWERV